MDVHFSSKTDDWATPNDDYEFVYTTIKREARKAGVRIINP